MGSSSQLQTSSTFSYKWGKRDTYESEALKNEYKRWLFEKYFDDQPDQLKKLFNSKPGKKYILDAGCGAGLAGQLLFNDYINEHLYFGVDISESVHVAKQRFHEMGLNGTFCQCDLNKLAGIFDIQYDVILSEGVLHHTDSVRESLISLSQHLRQGGHFLFYVYKKKAPVREFTDDLIREYLAPLSNEEAWEALVPLTKLGKALGELELDILVPDDIPYLGIKKGVHNLQRLFYYTICKSYYKPEFSLDEMNHINFDWFRPANCFRHTERELRSFCVDSKLKIIRLKEEESGISIIAEKI